MYFALISKACCKILTLSQIEYFRMKIRNFILQFFYINITIKNVIVLYYQSIVM